MGRQRKGQPAGDSLSGQGAGRRSVRRGGGGLGTTGGGCGGAGCHGLRPPSCTLSGERRGRLWAGQSEGSSPSEGHARGPLRRRACAPPGHGASAPLHPGPSAPARGHVPRPTQGVGSLESAPGPCHRLRWAVRVGALGGCSGGGACSGGGGTAGGVIGGLAITTQLDLGSAHGHRHHCHRGGGQGPSLSTGYPWGVRWGGLQGGGARGRVRLCLWGRVGEGAFLWGAHTENGCMGRSLAPHSTPTSLPPAPESHAGPYTHLLPLP